VTKKVYINLIIHKKVGEAGLVVAEKWTVLDLKMFYLEMLMVNLEVKVKQQQ